MGVMTKAKAELFRRTRNLLVSLDQLFGSVVSLGDAYPDETPSSYAWRLERKGRFFGVLFRPPIDWLFFVLRGQEDHCRKAYQQEGSRSDSPEEFRCPNCLK
jgi:hypothetical protein